jgi:uncharacterized protein (TIGR03067 family)
MKRLTWCLAALLVVLQAIGLAQDQPKGTTELDGTWQIISRNTEGFDWTEEELKAILVQRLVICGTKLKTLDKDGKVVSESPIKVYPKRIPPAIDMIGRDLFDPAEKWTIKCIYHLKGRYADHLLAGGSRPPTPQRLLWRHRLSPASGHLQAGAGKVMSPPVGNEHFKSTPSWTAPTS